MKCDQFYDLLAVRWGSVGGFISNFPVLCGGQDEYGPWADCEVVGNQNKHIMMSERRASASGVVLNKTTLWIVGNSNFEILYRLQFVGTLITSLWVQKKIACSNILGPKS